MLRLLQQFLQCSVLQTKPFRHGVAPSFAGGSTTGQSFSQSPTPTASPLSAMQFNGPAARKLLEADSDFVRHPTEGSGKRACIGKIAPPWSYGSSLHTRSPAF